MCCCWCCTTSPATAGRCGPLPRDLCGVLPGAAATGVAAALPALPVQYADYTLWQRAVLGEESDADSAIARQLAFWTERAAGSAGADRAAGRPAAACGVEPPRRQRAACAIGAELHRGLAGAGAGRGASLFMVLQAGLAALLTRLGAGTDIAIGSPIAGRTDAALDDLIGFFVNTLVLRTDTSGNPGFRELIGRVRAGNLAAYGQPGSAVRAAGRGAQPGAVAVAASAVPGDAGVRERAPAAGAGACRGSRCASSRSRAASAKFDLSVSAGRSGARPDGAPAGHRRRAGIRQRPVRPRQRRGAGGAADPAAGGRGCRCRSGRSAACEILSAAERAHHPAGWNDTAQRPVAGLPATLPALFAAQAARTPDAIAVVFEDAAAELRRARRPRQPAGASSARRSASGPRPWSGSASSARPRW